MLQSSLDSLLSCSKDRGGGLSNRWRQQQTRFFTKLEDNVTLGGGVAIISSCVGDRVVGGLGLL